MSEEPKMGRIYNPDPTIKISPADAAESIRALRLDLEAERNLVGNLRVIEERAFKNLEELERLRAESEALREELAAKDAELARLRGVEKVLRKARAFVGGLRGSQFASEQQHTEAYAVIHAIDNALSALPSPAEAGEKASCWYCGYVRGTDPREDCMDATCLKCSAPYAKDRCEEFGFKPAAPSDAKAGRGCEV
jgi:hypothetical protein